MKKRRVIIGLAVWFGVLIFAEFQMKDALTQNGRLDLLPATILILIGIGVISTCIGMLVSTNRGVNKK